MRPSWRRHGRSHRRRGHGVRGLLMAEKEQLIKLADIVTWARTGVERDYQGRSDRRSCAEMPTGSPSSWLRSCAGRCLWHARRAAMQLATRCARDSLDPLRRDLLLDVAANPGSIRTTFTAASFAR